MPISSRSSRSITSAAVLLCLAAIPAVRPAQAASGPQLVGSEMQVSINPISQQHNPVAAYDAYGRSMVVWENEELGLRGRLYDANGAPSGNELSLVANASWSVLPGSSPVTFHRDPAIVFLPSGNFLLAWAEEQGNLEWTIYFEDLDVHSREIVAQVYNVIGQAVGRPFTISSGGVGLKSRPQLAVRPTGNVVATWMSQAGPVGTPADEIGVFARLLSNMGRPIADAFRVDTVDGATGVSPALAVDPSGNFLIAWSSAQGSDTFNTNVYGNVFDPTGAPLGAPIAITSGSNGPQGRPTVADGANGTFLVAWQSYFNDVWHSRIDGQIVSTAGALVGATQPISTGTAQNFAEVSPTAVAAPGGTFALVWMEYEQWFPVGMAGIQVDATGAPIGSQVWINDNQINAQLRTALATDGAGHFLAPYEAFYNKSSYGILGQFFATH